MATIEDTIKNIEQRRRRTRAQMAVRIDQARQDDVERQQCEAEFECNYRAIKGLSDLQNEFVSWVNRQEIHDAQGKIANGEMFYEHLLQGAVQKYILERRNGYEQQVAFNHAAQNLASWLEKCADNNDHGAIYINYSPETLHRLRHLAED